MTDLAWGVSTHVGHSRQVNEDSYVALPPVFAVADGMGGHERGEVASGMVADRLRALAEGAPLDPEGVVDTIRSVHRSIRMLREPSSQLEMGTTLAAVVFCDWPSSAGWLLANVGDSRVYRLHSGEMEQLSVDHSVVQELIDAGTITAESARIHPERNVITRAIGVGDEIRADFAIREPEPGERILLCSDGVHGQLSHDEIRQILVGADDPQDAATNLVEAVLARRAPDNLTAVVIDVLVDPAETEEEIDEITSPLQELDALGSSATKTRSEAGTPVDESDSPSAPGGVEGDFIVVPRW